MRRAAHVDLAQAAIVAALRGVGCSVMSLAGVGVKGCPDLLVARNGEMILLEVKTPGLERGYSKRHRAEQADWCTWWKGKSAIVSTVDEALAAIGVEVQG